MPQHNTRPMDVRGSHQHGSAIAIISTRGPSVVSSSLLPSQSKIRRTSLPAHNPCAGLYSDGDASDDDACSAATTAVQKERPCSNKYGDVLKVPPSSLLVTDISCRRDVISMREGLNSNPEAQCLVEFCIGQVPCIMTLRESGFVWNQEIFVGRWSSQYESVAKHNPFLRRMCNTPRRRLSSATSTASRSSSSNSSGSGTSTQSDNSTGQLDQQASTLADYEMEEIEGEEEEEYGEGELLPIDNITVHEIHPEDCPRLF